MASKHPLPSFLLALAVVGGFGSILQLGILPEQRALRSKLERVEERIGELEGSVALLHFSRSPEHGTVEELLAYLEYWAGRYERFGSSLAEKPALDEHLGLARKALGALGPEAFDPLARAFLAPANAAKVQLRRELVVALEGIDRARCLVLARRQVESPAVHSEIRVACAEVMLEIDADVAGEALRSVLLSGSERGTRNPMPGSNGGAGPGRTFPGYADLIPLFLRSSFAQKEDVLLRLFTSTHLSGNTTAIELLRGFEQLGSRSAVGLIQERYEARAGPFTSSLLRRHALNVLLTIEGRRLCPWLRRQQRRERDPTMLRVLEALRAKHCG